MLFDCRSLTLTAAFTLGILAQDSLDTAPSSRFVALSDPADLLTLDATPTLRIATVEITSLATIRTRVNGSRIWSVVTSLSTSTGWVVPPRDSSLSHCSSFSTLSEPSLDAASRADASSKAAALAEQANQAESEEGGENARTLAIGASFGVVAGIMVLLGAFFLYRRRRRGARGHYGSSQGWFSEYKLADDPPPSPFSFEPKRSPGLDETFNEYIGRTSTASPQRPFFLAPPGSGAVLEIDPDRKPIKGQMTPAETATFVLPPLLRDPASTTARRAIKSASSDGDGGRSTGARSPSLRRWRISDIPEFGDLKPLAERPSPPRPSISPCRVYAQASSESTEEFRQPSGVPNTEANALPRRNRREGSVQAPSI
jgi:hypothetical protein